ncbi:carboxypeptidase-like regulatory domain-containing protein [Pirellulales bacterium]|nr:carboxypeptidase-like regulatory domain-containing protein [Pirellulales bacterium]
MRYHSCLRKHFHLPFFCVIILSSFGCGNSDANVEYVQGVVTLDGAPLEGATVFFSPKGSAGKGAAGTTQSDGSFTLNTQGAKPGDGTAVGDYSVTVSKVEMPEFPDIAEDDPRYGTPEHDRLQQEASSAKPKVIVPEKYNSAETSPFTAKVESGSNTFTFDISSKDD